jgi:uncharacterized HAD superfamily protein
MTVIHQSIWDRQLEFQRLVFPHWDLMTEQQRAAITRELAMHVISEIDEVLRETSWKIHRNPPGLLKVRSNMLEELIDAFKYWLAIFQLHGFAPSDLLAEFNRKSNVVEQRWRQEKELVLDPRVAFIIDIDATLADYVGGFLDYVSYTYNEPVDRTEVSSMDLSAECARILKKPIEDLVELKHQYRVQGGKLTLKPLPFAASMLGAIRKAGGQILLLTARPYETYKRVFADTLEWLDRWNLPYDALWMTEDKRDFLLRTLRTCRLVIEDNPADAERLAHAGYSVWMPAWPYNEYLVHPRIERLTLSQMTEQLETLVL